MIHSLTPDTMARSEQPDAAGLSLYLYTTWLEEVQNQPAWRGKADREMDYVDGNQLDADVLQRQQAIGMPPAVEPLIGPAIESVLGFEAKTRTDWRITDDTADGSGQEVAEALNYKVNQAERKSGADKACSDAFKPQLAVGLGWVEVAKETDPFKYPYRCIAIHRNEIFWDMLDHEPGLPKARYLIRRKWTDVAYAKLKFPRHRDLIDHSNGRWTDRYELSSDGGGSTTLAQSWMDERGWSIEEQEWRDATNSRVCLFEVWYRRWEEVIVIKAPDGRVIEYDPKNALHVIAVARGPAVGVEVTKAIIARMYVSFWMGPHKLYDGKTPYMHSNFPYVPFWGQREDRTGVPYGRVRGMIYLQDSVNSAISKIRWGLSSVRTVRTKGAVAYSDEVFRQQVARVDADIILNAEHMAQPGARFEVERDFQLSEQQFKMLADARLGIERASGITPGFQGRSGTARSGLQESTQVEQSTQALAATMDNFKEARAAVGERLLSLIVQDMSGKPEEVLIPATPMRDERRIQLNVPMVDEGTGVKFLTNDVERVKLKVAMSDVPTSPSFRSQQLAAMTEAFKSMPQEYQIVALPHLLSLMDVPHRDELIEDIRAAQQQLTPDQIQEKIDEAVKLALERSDHDLRARELDLKYNPDKLLAEINKMVSETVKNGVQSAFAAMQAGASLATMPQIAPVADAIMQGAGYQHPTPPGMDPNFPVPGGVPGSAAIPAIPAGVEPPADPTAVAPGAVQNTSPQLPPVPQAGESPMTGIETANPTDGTIA